MNRTLVTLQDLGRAAAAYLDILPGYITAERCDGLNS